jgi:hypothetical protein
MSSRTRRRRVRNRAPSPWADPFGTRRDVEHLPAGSSRIQFFNHGSQTTLLKYSYMLGGMFWSCLSAMCLRTISEYKKRSAQMRQCHWSKKMGSRGAQSSVSTPALRASTDFRDADSVARVGIAWHHRSRVARVRSVRNCRGGVDQVADILPHDGGPGLRAYVCPDCGAVDSVLVYPHQHHFRPEANPRRHGKWR